MGDLGQAGGFISFFRGEPRIIGEKGILGLTGRKINVIITCRTHDD